MKSLNWSHISWLSAGERKKMNRKLTLNALNGGLDGRQCCCEWYKFPSSLNSRQPPLVWISTWLHVDHTLFNSKFFSFSKRRFRLTIVPLFPVHRTKWIWEFLLGGWKTAYDIWWNIDGGIDKFTLGIVTCAFALDELFRLHLRWYERNSISCVHAILAARHLCV